MILVSNLDVNVVMSILFIYVEFCLPNLAYGQEVLRFVICKSQNLFKICNGSPVKFHPF